jgi:hypothetical protein
LLCSNDLAGAGGRTVDANDKIGIGHFHQAIRQPRRSHVARPPGYHLGMMPELLRDSLLLPKGRIGCRLMTAGEDGSLEANFDARPLLFDPLAIGNVLIDKVGQADRVDQTVVVGVGAGSLRASSSTLVNGGAVARTHTCAIPLGPVLG